MLLAFVSAAPSQVVMNEILLEPEPGVSNGDHQWVEIHNKGSQPVDLRGWTIANREGRDGSGSWPLPALTIPSGGYLVVHFATGTDSTEFGPRGAHVYSQGSRNLWNPAQDDAALYSPTKIVDYIAWSRFGTPYNPGEAHKGASAAGIWTQDAYLDLNAIRSRNLNFGFLLSPGQPLGRDAESTDADGLEDFAPRGGIDGFGPSPGTRNFRAVSEAFRFEEEVEAAAKAGGRAAAPKTKWTILVYCLESDMRLDWQFLTEARTGLIDGGVSSDVSVIVMLQDSASSVRRGRIMPVEQNQVTLLAPGGAGVLPGVVNLGQGATLAEFIQWAGEQYPSEHRALVIFGLGHGWKRSAWYRVPEGGWDALTPGEIRESLARFSFDYAAFVHRYSASAEVAREVQSITRNYLGSAREPHTYYVQPLVRETGAANSGREALSNMTVRWRRTYRIPFEYEVYSMDLTLLTPVIRAVDDAARRLLPMLPLVFRRNDPLDNAQMRIRAARNAASIGGPRGRTFDDAVDHIELVRFAGALLDSGLPDCGQRAALTELIRAIGALAIVDIDLPFLFAYFPARRESSTPELQLWEDGAEGINDGMYNHPGPLTRREGSPRLNPVVYGPNYDDLPFVIEPVPTVVDLTAPRDWPVPAVDSLLFTRETAWPRFLHFYYHPVAEVVIEGARPTDSGPCQNSYDYRIARIGESVALSGNGSSDPDRAERTPVPLHHFWDLNGAEPCQQRCVQPFEVPNGADPAEANDNMDAENHLTNTKYDDVDARGATATFVCQVPGRYFVFLHTWDDNHRFVFGDTSPSARHVHIQTGSHLGVIDCPPEFGGLLVSPLPPFLQTGDGVAADFAVRAGTQTRTAARAASIAEPPAAFSNVRGFLPNYPITVTGVAGVLQMKANGAGIPDGQSHSVLTDSEGILRLEFTAGAAGTGILRFQPFGTSAPIDLRFPIVARLAPPPDELIVTVPAAPARTGADTSVPVIVRRGGQPLQDAVVTAFSATSTLDFTFGTLFRSNTGTQIRTNSAGQATLQFRPRANGPVDIEIFAGTQVRRIQLQASGGPAQPPSVIEVVNPPEAVKVNEELILRVRVLAIRQPAPGVAVRMTGADLPASQTAQTGADGIAIFRLTPRDLTPLVLTFNVVGTTLQVAGSIGVRP